MAGHKEHDGGMKEAKEAGKHGMPMAHHGGKKHPKEKGKHHGRHGSRHGGKK